MLPCADAFPFVVAAAAVWLLPQCGSLSRLEVELRFVAWLSVTDACVRVRVCVLVWVFIWLLRYLRSTIPIALFFPFPFPSPSSSPRTHFKYIKLSKWPQRVSGFYSLIKVPISQQIRLCQYITLTHTINAFLISVNICRFFPFGAALLINHNLLMSLVTNNS